MDGFVPGPTYSAEDYAAALQTAMEQPNISDRMKAVKTLLDQADKGALQAIIDIMEDEQLEYFLELQNFVLNGTYDTMKEFTRLEQIKNVEKRDRYIIYLLHFYLNFPGPNELIEFYKTNYEHINSLFIEYKNSLSNTAKNITDYMTNTINDVKWFFSTAFTHLPDDEQTKIKSIYKNGKLLLKYNTENQSFEYNEQVTNIMMDKILTYLQKTNVRNKSPLDVKTLSQPGNYNSVFDKIESNNNNKMVKEAPSKYSEKHVTESKKQGIKMKPRLEALRQQRNQYKKNEKRTSKSFGSSISALQKLPGKTGKTGGKTRRKIRRNKKAKTKKRKANKKTKKRKMKRKTNMNRKKSKKRRTKK